MYEKPDFTEVESLDYHNARIVFQGTEGAYSQLALREYFGEQTDSYHVETWRDAMEAIKNGEADYAVLPIENSSAGIVSENYDLMVEYDNCIVGEQIIQINHALLGLPDAAERAIYCLPGRVHPRCFLRSPQGYLPLQQSRKSVHTHPPR